MRNDWDIPVFGLTGSIASGKTEAGKVLKELGGEVIDADKLLRYVTGKGRRAYSEIVGVFGRQVLDRRGRIDRALLAGAVFNNRRLRTILEGITHVEIMKTADRKIRRIAGRKFTPVFLEAALLIESGLHETLDGLIVVVCNEKLQIERLRRQRDMNDEEIHSRLRAQLPSREKAKSADWVIENNGDLHDLRLNTEAVFREMKRSKPFLVKKRKRGGADEKAKPNEVGP